MHRVAAVAAACALLFGLAGSAIAEEGPEPLPERPNIVVFYIDDAPPHDGRLWNDPNRTPNIYEQFIGQGVEFTNAIGENPLCCPARGNFLTGLHTHNNGVFYNQANLFDPSEHIGRAMMDAGYASMFIGKYLNRNNELTPEQWAQHDAGWTQLDVIKGVNGSFKNFTVHTKQAEFKLQGVHSTQFVANAAVTRFRETPAETPLFAVLSIYNLHSPNTPMAQDVGDPRCAAMPPYNPPNYNEADVSDKPTGIQALPLLPYPDGWPMVRYCEEMLGVDRAVGQVVDELEAEGRLDNTLLLFTADNGMAWGAHRIGQNKLWPYTTPVPQYMRWPAAGLGDEPDEIDEVVSNIDLAPTFCELAGPSCVLGPFAHGNEGPDGISITSLIDGSADNLGRDAVLEASFILKEMSYSALRTTAAFDPVARWHYIEHINGERELYDLVADEWEMDNIISNPEHAELIATLHDRLAELRLEGLAEGTGSITIRLDTTPDGSADYSFDGDLGPFMLDDDLDPTLPNELTWAGIPSGVHEVTRAAIAPWLPVGISCDGVNIGQVATGKVTIWLRPDEHITCTYTDAEPLPPPPPPPPRPDAMVSLTMAGTYKKDNLYQVAPNTKQAVRRNGVRVGRVYDYHLRIQNDSLGIHSMVVTGSWTGPNTVTATYLFNGIDVTGQVVAGTFTIPDLAPTAVAQMVVRLTIGSGTPRGSLFKAVVSVRSATDPAVIDAVRVVAAR